MSREQELYDFMMEAWPGRCGDKSTLPRWLGKAQLAFPSVDLVKEAKKAFMWEAARPSRADEAEGPAAPDELVGELPREGRRKARIGCAYRGG